MTDDQYLSATKIEESPAGAQASAPNETAPQAPTEMFEFYSNGQSHKFPMNSEFNVLHDGKYNKVPFNNLINTYRKASHLENKWTNEYKPAIDRFHQDQEAYNKYKGFYDKYGSFQEWSEKNPDEWNRIWDLYQNKDKYLQNNGQDYNPLLQELGSLKAQFGELSKFHQEFQKHQEEAQAQADVQSVRGEIDSFKKEFPDIDLEETDPDGVKLWAKIVNFGIQNRLPDFESAALKYLKPRLLDTVSARARNDAVKGLQKAKASGEVARSSTPFNVGQGDKKIDFKNKSYNELLEIGRQMLNQA